MSAPPAEFALGDENATARLGAALAHAIAAELDAVREHGLVVLLAGDLGAGKTSLVRAALRALGIGGPVRSPTFTLVEPYVVSSLDFYHFDFYRLADPREFALAGFREMFGRATVCLIEWPEKAAGYLPPGDLRVTMRVDGNGRLAAVAAVSELGAACLQRIATEMSRPTG
jgi:tRNA threonylcarbamoyladenosine biosynthesis protein TsaE